MNFTSLRAGTLRMTQGSRVSRVAAMMGSTAFLAPLMATSPHSGTPPLINRLSMMILVDRRGAEAGGEVDTSSPLCLRDGNQIFAIKILGR